MIDDIPMPHLPDDVHVALHLFSVVSILVLTIAIAVLVIQKW